jgi:hypothetical protein
LQVIDLEGEIGVLTACYLFIAASKSVVVKAFPAYCPQSYQQADSGEMWKSAAFTGT